MTIAWFHVVKLDSRIILEYISKDAIRLTKCKVSCKIPIKVKWMKICNKIRFMDAWLLGGVSCVSWSTILLEGPRSISKIFTTESIHFSIQNEFTVFELIFTPDGTKIRFVREFAEIPPHTMTEAGFCLLGMYRSCSGMSWTLLEMIRSFWGLETSWIVNSFSWENIILSTMDGQGITDNGTG